MEEQIVATKKKDTTVWQFIKYTVFCILAGGLEIGSFVLLKLILPAKGINRPISWFLFVYPTEYGGLGALIAFVVSSTLGQSIKFLTNFKSTFKSTNNMLLSAFGYAIMAIIIIIGLNLYIGGLLNTALGKVIANKEIASTIAKLICQFTSFIVAFPINKYVIMRNTGEKKQEETK